MMTKVYSPKIQVSYNPGKYKSIQMINLHREVEQLLIFYILRQASSAECLQFQSMRISLGQSFQEKPRESFTGAKIIWSGIEEDLGGALAIS